MALMNCQLCNGVRNYDKTNDIDNNNENNASQYNMATIITHYTFDSDKENDND